MGSGDGGAQARDHPRLRGEKCKLRLRSISITGSPPPARGKAPETSLYAHVPGITPACAGKRLENNAVILDAEDHPRLRGEKIKSLVSDVRYPGSPPPARGKVSTHGNVGEGCRITPACAGKSPQYQAEHTHRKDHPRLRGEKYDQLDYLTHAPGSPPPARGKAISPSAIDTRRRITPACAGKSRFSFYFFLREGDHPRLRGEK